MKKTFKLLATLMSLITAMIMSTMSAFAADYNVDWEGGVITATGVGFPADFARTVSESKATAREAAETVALGKLAGAVNGIQVDAENTVENMRLKSSEVRTKVSGVIRGAQVIDVKYVEGACYVTMQVSMFGVSSLAGAVLETPQVIEPIPDPVPTVAPSPVVTTTTTTTTTTIDLTPSTTIPTGSPATEVSSRGAVGGYTGVIIDCTGLGLKPVMSPVIKNDKGQAIYGHKNLNPDLVIEKGMAGYSTGMNNLFRAGSNPLILKAVALDGHNANPVLTTADANRLLVENAASKFLDNLNVVFVR